MRRDDARVNKLSSMLVNVCFSFVWVDGRRLSGGTIKKRPRPLYIISLLLFPLLSDSRLQRANIWCPFFSHIFSLTFSSSLTFFLVLVPSVTLSTIILIRALLQGGDIFLLLFAAAAPAAAVASTSRKPLCLSTSQTFWMTMMMLLAPDCDVCWDVDRGAPAVCLLLLLLSSLSSSSPFFRSSFL